MSGRERRRLGTRKNKNRSGASSSRNTRGPSATSNTISNIATTISCRPSLMSRIAATSQNADSNGISNKRPERRSGRRSGDRRPPLPQQKPDERQDQKAVIVSGRSDPHAYRRGHVVAKDQAEDEARHTRSEQRRPPAVSRRRRPIARLVETVGRPMGTAAAGLSPIVQRSRPAPDIHVQPIPLTIDGPSRLASGSGNRFQAATNSANLGLSGFRSGISRPAAKPELIDERRRLEAPIALERVCPGADLAAPEIEHAITAFARPAHHLPIHEVVCRQPARRAVAAAVKRQHLVPKIKIEHRRHRPAVAGHGDDVASRRGILRREYGNMTWQIPASRDCGRFRRRCDGADRRRRRFPIATRSNALADHRPLLARDRLQIGFDRGVDRLAEDGVEARSRRPVGTAFRMAAHFEHRHPDRVHQPRGLTSSARRLSSSAAIGPPWTPNAFEIKEDPNSADLTWVSGSTPVNVPARSASR